MKVEILARWDESKGIKMPFGLKIKNLAKSGKQRFMPHWLRQWKQFITQTTEQIILHGVDGDVVYRVDYAPGRHCMTCGESLPDERADPLAEQCRAHVAAHDDAIATERWPHGYISTNAFNCTQEV